MFRPKKIGPQKLRPKKFCQNQVSNSWDIPDMDKYPQDSDSCNLASNSLDIADLDKWPQDKCCLANCRGDSCNLLYMFQGPFV